MWKNKEKRLTVQQVQLQKTSFVTTAGSKKGAKQDF